LVDKNGRILAHSVDSEFSDSGYDEEWLVNVRVPDELNNSLLRIGAVTEFEGFEAANILVAPVVGGSRRVGSLLFAGTDAKFDDDDMVIAEFAATAIGMIIANRIDLQQEDEAQEVKLARSAINSLSYSEILAMQHIFDELDGNEGLLVASRIADNAGITRSVIVNALRKLASAGVVESRSLGMKGTYLRILNKEIRNEFERQRYPYPKQ
jgi:transcriptional pleiotropic repressor